MNRKTIPWVTLIFVLVYLAVWKGESINTKLHKNDNQSMNKLLKELKLNQCTFYYTPEGRVGCKAPKSSVTGVIYGVFNQADVGFIASNSELDSKYVFIMPYNLFTSENVRTLLLSGKMAGVILMSQNKGYFFRPDEWSPMSQNPNWAYGIYRNKSPINIWNPKGFNDVSSIYDFNISTLNVNSNGSNSIYSTLFEAIVYNLKRNYTGAHLKAINYKTEVALPIERKCIKSNDVVKDICAPIGGQSVWATFSDDMMYDDGKPIIMVITKMDPVDLSLSFNQGSESVKAGLSVVMSIANNIRAIRDLNFNESPEMTKHVVFAFFYGESFGYSGSKTFIRDLLYDFECLKKEEDLGICPVRGAFCSNPCTYTSYHKAININNIEYIIELDSVGNLYNEINGSNSYVYMHSYQSDAQAEKLHTKFVGTYASVQSTPGTQFDVLIEPVFKNATTNKGLPPSSLMSFLEKRDIPSLLFSSYKNKFSNPYYYSTLDSKNYFSPQHISYMCTLVDVISNAIYKDISLIPDGKFKKTLPNCSFLEDILSCITGNSNCNMGKIALLDPSILNDLNPDTNAFEYKIKPFPYFVNRIMTLITRARTDVPCKKDSDCKDNYICSSYVIVSNKRTGVCISGLSFYHNSYSPGISYDPKKRAFRISNKALGVWVTPLKLSTKSYLVTKTSLKYQLLQLLFGISSTTVLCISYYYFQKKYILFT